MADIFISYARQDRESAQRLAGALEKLGWSVWWDRRIPTGKRFEQVIEEQLAAARCVIALWSRAGIASSWVREEAAHGREHDILAPVLLEAVRPPFGFRTIQTADLREWRGSPHHPGFRDLVRDISASLGPPVRVEAAAAVEGLESETAEPPGPRPQKAEPQTKGQSRTERPGKKRGWADGCAFNAQ